MTSNDDQCDLSLTRETLDLIIKEAKKSNNWQKVVNANVSETKDMSGIFSESGFNQDISDWVIQDNAINENKVIKKSTFKL